METLPNDQISKQPSSESSEPSSVNKSDPKISPPEMNLDILDSISSKPLTNTTEQASSLFSLSSQQNNTTSSSLIDVPPSSDTLIAFQDTPSTSSSLPPSESTVPGNQPEVVEFKNSTDLIDGSFDASQVSNPSISPLSSLENGELNGTNNIGSIETKPLNLGTESMIDPWKDSSPAKSSSNHFESNHFNEMGQGETENKENEIGAGLQVEQTLGIESEKVLDTLENAATEQAIPQTEHEISIQDTRGTGDAGTVEQVTQQIETPQPQVTSPAKETSPSAENAPTVDESSLASQPRSESLQASKVTDEFGEFDKPSVQEPTQSQPDCFGTSKDATSHQELTFSPPPSTADKVTDEFGDFDKPSAQEATKKQQDEFGDFGDFTTTSTSVAGTKPDDEFGDFGDFGSSNVVQADDGFGDFGDFTQTATTTNDDFGDLNDITAQAAPSQTVVDDPYNIFGYSESKNLIHSLSDLSAVDTDGVKASESIRNLLLQILPDAAPSTSEAKTTSLTAEAEESSEGEEQSGKRLVPNTVFKDELWYKLWQQLSSESVFDENLSTKIRWRRSYARKQFLVSLDIPVNLDDVYKGERKLKTSTSQPLDSKASKEQLASGSTSNLTAINTNKSLSGSGNPMSPLNQIQSATPTSPLPDVDTLTALCDVTEDELRTRPIEELKKLESTMRQYISTVTEQINYYLDAREQLAMDSEMHNKMISALVTQAQKTHELLQKKGSPPKSSGSRSRKSSNR